MDVIALSTGEALGEALFEYQDNSVSDFLAHSSRVLLAGDAEKKAEELSKERLLHWLTGHCRGFETIKQPELRFRVLLTEGGSELKLARAQRKEARRTPPHQGSLALTAMIGYRRSRTKEPGRKSP